MTTRVTGGGRSNIVPWTIGKKQAMRAHTYKSIDHYHYLGGSRQRTSLPFRLRCKLIAHLVPCVEEMHLTQCLNSVGADIVVFLLLGWQPATTLRTAPLSPQLQTLMANASAHYAGRVSAGEAGSSSEWAMVLNGMCKTPSVNAEACR